AALAGRDSGDDVRAVALVPQAVEGALTAGEALDEQARLAVDDDRHYFRPFSTRRGSASRPSETRSASSARTRSASASAQPVRSSHASNATEWSARRASSTRSPADWKSSRHSSSV